MDRTTELLSSYACNLTYEDLPPAVIHQVKRTVADTLGCAIGGYLSEPAKSPASWPGTSPAARRRGSSAPTTIRRWTWPGSPTG